MSSQCLWHACRALSAGLLLMLLGAAMAVIGYYADTLSVAEEVRGNATVSVKDEARGFHLNNLSYAGPIVMGFGGFIVVAACVMTFEARDSAAKVTPARPQALPRPLPRRGPPCAAPARLDQLGIYRLPHVLPLPHAPHAPTHRARPHCHRSSERAKERARFGSAPDLRSGSARATPSLTALRRPLRRYALSVDEPPQSAVSASAVESECGSQSSLALELHGAGGASSGVTLRVRDNMRDTTRRRPLARQPRLRDDSAHPSGESFNNISNIPEIISRNNEENSINSREGRCESYLTVEADERASSAPPAPQRSPTPSVHIVRVDVSPSKIQDTCILIEECPSEEASLSEAKSPGGVMTPSETKSPDEAKSPSEAIHSQEISPSEAISLSEAKPPSEAIHSQEISPSEAISLSEAKPPSEAIHSQEISPSEAISLSEAKPPSEATCTTEAESPDV